MKHCVMVGCSFTAGTGWNQSDPTQDCREDARLWTNLCHSRISRLKHLHMMNLGKSGASNTEIFENCVRAISQNELDIDVMFCQWTSAPRYRFNVGFELWDTSEDLGQFGPIRSHDVSLNNGDTWTRTYINDLLDRLRVLHHLHWEIVRVVDYSNMLAKLAQHKGIDIFFVNGICPWDNNYFLELKDVEPEHYTEFTKTRILNIDSRDDNDIHTLYHLAHKHYRTAGHIDEARWLNLYRSLRHLQIDCNFDGLHPGPKSNEIYYGIIKQQLDSTL